MHLHIVLSASWFPLGLMLPEFKGLNFSKAKAGEELHASLWLTTPWQWPLPVQKEEGPQVKGNTGMRCESHYTTLPDLNFPLTIWDDLLYIGLVRLSGKSPLRLLFISLCTFAFSVFKNNFIYLLIFGCTGSSILHRLLSSCIHGLLIAVFLLLRSTWASVALARELSSCGSRALTHRLNSCGTRAA